MVYMQTGSVPAHDARAGAPGTADVDARGLERGQLRLELRDLVLHVGHAHRGLRRSRARAPLALALAFALALTLVLVLVRREDAWGGLRRTYIDLVQTFSQILVASWIRRVPARV